MTQVISHTSVEPVPATAAPLIVLGRFRLGSAALLPLGISGPGVKGTGKAGVFGFVAGQEFHWPKLTIRPCKQFCC